MTFSELEKQAIQSAKGQTASKTVHLSPSERLCLECLTELYRKFQLRGLSREVAQPIKAEIRVNFERLEQERTLWAVAYAQYQESIRLASGEREQLPILAQSGSWEMVARSALRILSAMTGESITEKAILKQMEARHDRETNAD